MLSSVSFLLLVVTLGATVQGGPQALPKADMTDQQLFWGADQYEFSTVLRAEGLQCFWHFAHRGETFYLNFMVRPEHLEAWRTCSLPDKHRRRGLSVLNVENIDITALSLSVCVCVPVCL